MLLPLFIGGLRTVHDHKIRLIADKLFGGRTDKHIGNEVCLPGNLHDKTHCKPGIFVSPAESVYHKQALAGQLISNRCAQIIPDLLIDCLIIVAPLIGPPQGIAGLIVFDDILVFRGTTRKLTGINGYGAEISQNGTFKTL